jgi:hypothetical protein
MTEIESHRPSPLVDDGSASIDCIQWFERDTIKEQEIKKRNPKQPVEPRFKHIPPPKFNSVIEMIAMPNVKSFRIELKLISYGKTYTVPLPPLTILPVTHTDSNAEPRFWLKVIDLHRTHYSSTEPFTIPQPPPAAIPPPEEVNSSPPASPAAFPQTPSSFHDPRSPSRDPQTPGTPSVRVYPFVLSIAHELTSGSFPASLPSSKGRTDGGRLSPSIESVYGPHERAHPEPRSICGRR